MSISNNQSHLLAYHTFTHGYLQFSLVEPPFGFILQVTPHEAFLISTNNNQDLNIIYEVYRPCVAMPRNFHYVGYSRVTNFELEQMGRYVMEVINIELEQVGRDVMQVMILKLRNMERVEIHNPSVANASPSVFTPIQQFLDLNMPPPVQLFDLNMHPSVQPLDLNMPPPVQPLDLNMPPPVQPLDLNMPPMEEDDHMAMHQLDNQVHFHEEEVVMTSITLDSVLNILTSNYDPTTYEENLELEEQMGRVNSRLSDETIMQHMQITCYTITTKSSSEEPDICVICQVEFENDESIGGLQCGHQYHVECIKKWLQEVNKCPICKAAAVS